MNTPSINWNELYIGIALGALATILLEVFFEIFKKVVVNKYYNRKKYKWLIGKYAGGWGRLIIRHEQGEMFKVERYELFSNEVKMHSYLELINDTMLKGVCFDEELRHWSIHEIYCAPDKKSIMGLRRIYRPSERIETEEWVKYNHSPKFGDISGQLPTNEDFWLLRTKEKNNNHSKDSTK